MNTNRDVLSGSDLEMPSGFEVEAATFRSPAVTPSVPVTPDFTVVTPASTGSGMKEKLNSLKSQSRVKLHEMQRVVNDKTVAAKSSLERSMTTAKSNMQQSLTSARSSLQTGLSDVQTDMRVNPMKWAGIAAGSGFALGMLGRLIHWRNRHRHVHGMPQLVIIESAC